MVKLKIFKTIVLWIDGEESFNTMQGIDLEDVEGQLLEQHRDVRDQILNYWFFEVGTSQIVE
jgi:hypothetical protein